MKYINCQLSQAEWRDNIVKYMYNVPKKMCNVPVVINMQHPMYSEYKYIYYIFIQNISMFLISY